MQQQAVEKRRGFSSALEHFDELPDSAEVKGSVVDGLYDISKATRWRWINMGRLPRPNERGRFGVGVIRANKSETTA